jgi:hypothetical protein
VLGILDFVGKGAAPFVGQLGVETARGFVLSCSPWSYGPSVASENPEVAPPGDLLEQYLSPSVHRAGCNWDLR